ncbi:lipid A biosynthesis lauroyl acyltransferase [Bartonella ancashensis]|uniref:lipid A biosynthesis lauroyl acyltransferase n=1 Tax=Bartonella ancashensis TaxID=1318743 RepID=UPI0006B556D3|nr:lipid A biosynthesis lauroyl acyltransferase [Bartonella ancashensis]
MIKSYIKYLIYHIKIITKNILILLWSYSLISFLAILRHLPIKIGLSFFSWLAKTLGPHVHRHKIALNNLKAAYPEKTQQELHEIVMEMWENMGLLLAEYVFLDKIFDFDPDAEKPGLIEVSGIEIFKRLRNEKNHTFFYSSYWKFELLPVCAQKFSLNMTVLFRPPNNFHIAKRVFKARQTSMGNLVPSQAGAVWTLAEKLAKGENVGMLVDQKFRQGISSTFFNRPLKTNPLIIKLARQYKCDIYPARCIRLPGGRHRLELYERIELPSKADNEIDIDASVQKLNDIVETWVREHPGQWMWFHKRWDA